MGGRKKSNAAVRIFKMANSLKVKLGRARGDENPGYLPEEAIEEAQQLINTLCEECPATVSGYLEQLTKKWRVMRDMPQSAEREDIGKEIFTIAHEVKDIAAMCGFELTAYFAESLRDYIARTELNMEAQRVIIQAHMDALSAVHKMGLKEEGGDAAEELKLLVKVAIDKFS